MVLFFLKHVFCLLIKKIKKKKKQQKVHSTGTTGNNRRGTKVDVSFGFGFGASMSFV